jgi:hypothetical protein
MLTAARCVVAARFTGPAAASTFSAMTNEVTAGKPRHDRADETFLSYARWITAPARPYMVRYAPAGHLLADYLGGTYGRSAPPTSSWPVFRAYLVQESAPDKVIRDSRRAWRGWLRGRGREAEPERDPEQLELELGDQVQLAPARPTIRCR